MIFIIGMIIFYINLNLFSVEVIDVVISLFIFVFEKVGFVFVVFVMNVVILIFVLFVGNLGFYVFIRMFWVMVCDKKVFKFLGKVNCCGILMVVLIVMMIVGVMIFIIMLIENGIVIYMWLFFVFGLIGFIVWVGIVISYYCF